MKSPSHPDLVPSADDWFASGRRVYFDPNQKRIVSNTSGSSGSVLSVFERTSLPSRTNAALGNTNTRWLTMLPGFPDGSYGFAKVDRLLEQRDSVSSTPRLYVEYVGQGDSDKPTRNYKYSTMERADLVEAQWRAHRVKRTVVVSFDYSSIVLLELFRRQQEDPSFPTKIEHALMMNGGLFADGHTHPWTTTPLLKTRFGHSGTEMAQKSNFVFHTMLSPLYSKSYRTHSTTRKQWKYEMRESVKAMRRHKGATFLSNAAGFVDEHKENAERLNLFNIYVEFLQQEGVTLQLVGSDGDQFEHRQIDLASQRMKAYYPQVQVERIKGGHLITAEKAEDMADMIEVLCRKTAVMFGNAASNTRPGWTSVA